MINYSVSLKSNRGNDAATYPTKAYATAQIDEVVSLERFAKHISDHGSVYSRADIYAVLISAVDCLRELILEGKKVSLGDLGKFYPTIKSKGANTKADFSTSNITKLTVGWSKGEDLKNMKDDADFNYVATRAVQAQSAAAEKKTTTQDGFTVTITKAESSDDDNDTGDGGTGAGSGTTSDSGSDSGSGTGSDSGSGTGSDSGSGTGSDSGSGMEGE